MNVSGGIVRTLSTSLINECYWGIFRTLSTSLINECYWGNC